MTESEKAAAGFLYDANYDEELARQRAECKDKCHRYNLCLPSDTAQQDEIMRGILGKAGNGLHITAPFWCDYGYNIFVGDYFYSNHNLIINDGVKVSFGDHVFIAPNCCFTTAEHPVDPEQRKAGLEIARPITVGSNVWIGAGTTVLAGVTIGDNSVIGAGSVVSRSIPGNVVAVGVPCRVMREISEEDKYRYPLYNGN